jgi:acyl dehydratase
MKKRFVNIALALVVSALLSPVAFASVKTQTVTFVTDVKIGETLIKKGTYKAKFDDQSNELTILDGKKVVAKTTATLVELKKHNNTSLTVYTTDRDSAGNAQLTSVNMGGKFATINADKAAGAATSAAQ